MKKSDLFMMAWQNLRNRKTRTRLTIVGVVIGTCAIIIMVSIGIGIDKMITSQYAADTSLNKISVYQYSDDDSQEKEMPFDDSAVKYFESIDHVSSVVPSLEISSYVKITRGKYTYSGTVYGVPLSTMESAGYKLEAGSFSGIGEKNCAFFGKETITSFSDAQGNSPKYSYDENYNITDSEINLMKDNITLTVTGNGSDYEQSDSGAELPAVSGSVQRMNVKGILGISNSADYESTTSVYIDLDEAKKFVLESNRLSGTKNYKLAYTNINVYVDDTSNIDAVKTELQSKGYSCSSADEGLKEQKRIMKIVQLILGAIGAVSMFVAAFGISNTMVMSVFERTKEIGIMKVLGCDIRDIKNMFLYEAGIIGLIGGVIGVAVSYIISIAANAVARVVMKSMAESVGEGFTVCVSSIPIWLALCGIIFSVGVGVLAGYSPASRSVKVSALTAIHNE